MARISYGSRETLPAELQALWDRVLDYAPFASLLGAMARRPPIFARMFAMQAELRDQGRLSRRHRELAKVAVSRLNACPYCVAHHQPLLTVQGLSAEGAASTRPARARRSRRVPVSPAAGAARRGRRWR